jgi:hypothetical protein
MMVERLEQDLFLYGFQALRIELGAFSSIASSASF